MKKFQFALDGVLGYRQQVLEDRQNEYASALGLVREQQERVETLREKYRQLNEKFRRQASEGITAADAMGYEYGLQVLEAEITRETQRLQELSRQAEEKRSGVLQAHLDAAVLERLKEKKRDAYRKQEQKSDEQFIDELVSAEWAAGTSA